MRSRYLTSNNTFKIVHVLITPTVTPSLATTTTPATTTVPTTAPPTDWRIIRCKEIYEAWSAVHGPSSAPATPSIFSQPDDCTAFVECIFKKTPYGYATVYTEHYCKMGTRFNTDTLQCDTAENVALIRPECPGKVNFSLVTLNLKN